MSPTPNPDRTTIIPIPLTRFATDLDNLCADVAEAVAGPLAGRDGRVGTALAPYL